MSQIISQWISTVGLKPIASNDLDKAFQSGYMFGKLLDKLNVKDRFGVEFQNASHTDALVVNYSQLQKTLHEKLGIELSVSDALDLIHAKPGAAAKLLYQIKTSAALVSQNNVFGHARPPFESYPTSPVEQSSQKPDKEPVPLKFAQVLKARINKLVPEKAPVKEIKPKRELPPLPNDWTTKKKITIVEPKERKKKVPKAAEKPEIVDPSQALRRKKLSENITDFESRMSRMLLEDNEEQSVENLLETPLTTEEVTDYLQNRAQLTQNQHLETLEKQLPPKDIVAKQSKEYMHKIRVMRQEEELSRREREQRRRKMLLLNEQSRREQEQKHVQDQMLSKLLRQSKQERRIAEQLMQIRHEKEVMHENRIFRDQQYQEQRNKEYKEAIDREFFMYERVRQEFQQTMHMQLEQHRSILEAKEQKRHERNVHYFRNVVDELLVMCFKIADHRELNDFKPVPPKKMREWKTLFANAVSLEAPEVVPLQNDSIPKVKESDEEEQADAIALLDTQEFKDYINNEGSWASQAPVTNNPILGQILETLLDLTAPVEEPKEIQTIPKVPIKIAVLGKKFAGKSTLAKKLSLRYGLRTLVVDDLIKEAIQEADITKKEKTADKDAKLTKAQLGALIQLQLVQGQSPEDGHLVDLIVHALNEPSFEYPGGWVLVNFPKTREQAMLLEKELSGYEDPKPVKRGDLKRGKDKPGQKNKSLIAPTDSSNDTIVQTPSSGLDAVFLLDVPNQVCLSRAAGQLVDAVSNKSYHIESNPPPKNQPGTFDRISFVDGQPNAVEQVQYFLAAFEDEEESLKEWFNRFKTLKSLDGVQPLENTFEECVLSIQTTLEQREAKSADRKVSVIEPPRESTMEPVPTELFVEPIPTHIKREPNKPSRECAEILIDQWATVESGFTDIIKFSFRSLRREQQNSLNYFYQTKTHFSKFLARPDREQKIIDTFQLEYNAIEEDLRSDPDVKAELHQRCEDLREKLWELSDKRREEAEQERLSILEDKWVEDKSYIIANIFITMMQAEVDRFQQTRQLLSDYYRDAGAVALADPAKPGLRIPLLQPTQAPPVDVSTLLISNHVQQQQKQQQNKPGQTKQNPAPAPTGKEKKSEKQQPKQEVQKHVIPMTLEKEPIVVDYENQVFPDLNASVDFVLNNLVSLDQGIDLKKEEKTDLQKALELEDKLLRFRLDRIKQSAIEHLKEFRNKAYQVYIVLDDWICKRYGAEMTAVKDLVTIVKEAIEQEQRLPNKLVLMGEKVLIDFTQLMYEPEPEPRPQSPVQKQMQDQFTILQITSMCKELAKIAPSGMIQSKTFTDFLAKTQSLSLNYDLVSDNYSTADLQQLQQLVYVLDPFETGYISWRKFLLMHCKILPIGLQEIQTLRGHFEQKQMTQSDFFELKLWFETEQVKGKFDRSTKMKQCLYELYSEGLESFDWKSLLLGLCMDDLPYHGLEKAFAAVGLNGKCTLDQIYDILHHGLLLVDYSARQTGNDDPYPKQLLQTAFEVEQELSFDQFSEFCERSTPQILTCPVYQLVDVSLSTQSRPSSGQEANRL